MDMGVAPAACCVPYILQGLRTPSGIDRRHEDNQSASMRRDQLSTTDSAYC